MQHEPGSSLHRSTKYRRKKKAPAVTGRGRKRVCPITEDATLGLAAGILEEIQKSGRCQLWKLTRVRSLEWLGLRPEMSSILDVRPDAVVDTEADRDAVIRDFNEIERNLWHKCFVERVQNTPYDTIGEPGMLRGSDETVELLRSWKLPAKNILYAVALVLLEGIGERLFRKGDSIVKKRGSRKNSEFFAEAEAVRAERFPDSCGRTRAYTAVCNVREFRMLGLDRKMCSYLRKHQKTLHALRFIRDEFGPFVPLDTAPAVDGAVSVMPELTRDIMSRLGVSN